ncbi:MAG TPA: CYTH domain-containing protein, partial [Gemmatimonadales bacterium]|nr:CYTH domain-containing protein [Gemmatimonadales bacterium]
MNREREAEVKWDVASPELLRELIASPPPAGLRVTATTHSFHRDIYYDTTDGALARRDVTCRFRLGADDRRTLTVTLAATRERFTSMVADLDLAAALRGDSEAARRLRGLVDPTTLEPLAEFEVERVTRGLAG